MSLTNAGETFRRFLAEQPQEYGPGPGYIDDLQRFMDTFIEITKTNTKFKGISAKSPHTYSSVKTVIDNGYTYNNVGIICVYAYPDRSGSHAVPYVKMNDNWYVGDDEKGMLILRKNGPPTWQTKYSKTWTVYSMYYFYINEIVPLFPFKELNRYGFHGKIAFKQHESSCWGDSIQTIVMNSNGFREQFVHLYNLVKSTPGLVSGEPVVVLKRFMARLAEILAITPALQKQSSREYKLLLLLSLSFIRMITWEPPYTMDPYVDHLEGTRGTRLLQLDDSEGAEPGPDIRISEVFGGRQTRIRGTRTGKSRRKSKSTRKSKNKNKPK